MVPISFSVILCFLAFLCVPAPLRENVFAFVIQSVSRLSARSFFFFACVAPLRETPSFVLAFPRAPAPLRETMLLGFILSGTPTMSVNSSIPEFLNSQSPFLSPPASLRLCASHLPFGISARPDLCLLLASLCLLRVRKTLAFPFPVSFSLFSAPPRLCASHLPFVW
jgi:hypothetical protein